MPDIVKPEIRTIVIIDSHPVSRQGLATLLGIEFSKTSILQAKNMADLRVLDPDFVTGVFLLVINSDFEEEENNPVAELKTSYPAAHIVLYGEEMKAEVMIDYLKSGVNGYLLKHKDLTELVSCVIAVASGKRYLSTDHLEFLFAYLIENYKTSKKHALLTPRQKEVAKLLVQGLTTSAIAERTGLHISTISTFKAAIFAKLGIDNILKLKQILEGEDDIRPV